MDLEQTLTELRMEHLRIDRVIRQLEELSGEAAPPNNSRIVTKRRGRPPGSKNRPKRHISPFPLKS